MNLRIALLELAAEHQLDCTGLQRLEQLAGLNEEPPSLRPRLPLGIAALAAALLGFGVILWIAANWETFGRFGRFALLQSLVLAACAGALLRPAARGPLALLALLGIGGLLAFFGQTYQSGADPWQLFAVWAALSLPLCVAVRSDLLWAPWALVAMTGISLWNHAHVGHSWRVRPEDLSANLVAWGAALLLVGLFSGVPRRFTGIGVWGVRTATTLTILLVTFTAITALFARATAPQFLFALLLLGGAAAHFARRTAFDVYALSAVALAVDTLLVSGLLALLLEHLRHDGIGVLLLVGLVAAGLLAGSVQIVYRLAREHEPAGERS